MNERGAAGDDVDGSETRNAKKWCQFILKNELTPFRCLLAGSFMTPAPPLAIEPPSSYAL
jgi:hypothetical protein